MPLYKETGVEGLKSTPPITTSSQFGFETFEYLKPAFIFQANSKSLNADGSAISPIKAFGGEQIVGHINFWNWFRGTGDKSSIIYGFNAPGVGNGLKISWSTDQGNSSRGRANLTTSKNAGGFNQGLTIWENGFIQINCDENIENEESPPTKANLEVNGSILAKSFSVNFACKTTDSMNIPASPSIGDTWKERDNLNRTIQEWEWDGIDWVSTQEYQMDFANGGNLALKPFPTKRKGIKIKKFVSLANYSGSGSANNGSNFVRYALNQRGIDYTYTFGFLNNDSTELKVNETLTMINETRVILLSNETAGLGVSASSINFPSDLIAQSGHFCVYSIVR